MEPGPAQLGIGRPVGKDQDGLDGGIADMIVNVPHQNIPWHGRQSCRLERCRREIEVCSHCHVENMNVSGDVTTANLPHDPRYPPTLDISTLGSRVVAEDRSSL